MQSPGDAGHVEKLAGAIVDMRQHGDRDLIVEQAVDRRAIPADQPPLHRPTRGPHRAFDDVEIGRERLVLGNDDVAAGPQSDGGLDSLEEIDRGRVANEGLTGSGPKQRSDAVTEPGRHVEPSSAVPAPDQVVSPLLFDRVVQDTGGGARHRAERIAVEIDDAFGEHEPVAEAAQRIGGIARDVRLARSHGGKWHHQSLVIKNQTTCLKHNGIPH